MSILTMYVVFDIETDGLLETVTKTHCIVLTDNTGYTLSFPPDRIAEGVSLLQQLHSAEVMLVGHNIINYDIPVLQKLYGFRLDNKDAIHDTLVYGRLVYSNLKDMDMPLLRNGTLPAALMGKHSLEAWGYRLGSNKGAYGKTEGAWERYSEEMLTYCIQDVALTHLLYQKVLAKEYAPTAVALEHSVMWLMAQQMRNGVKFDTKKAEELQVKLQCRLTQVEQQILKFIPELPDKPLIPKRNNKAKGYIAGVPVQRFKTFNPNSRQHIKELLAIHKYTPADAGLYDEKGMLTLDDVTFAYIKADPLCPKDLQQLACVFEEYLLVSKRLGQLATGKQAWLKHVTPEGFIYGYINPNGAVSGRATHAFPNIAQVPKCGSPYGAECRELYTVPNGWVQVGVDASGLELRCLAHYLAPYDNGQYSDTILNGDIHTVNQKAAGLPTRDNAKTFIYAFLIRTVEEVKPCELMEAA